jgi:hypothetical protein
MAAKRTIPLPPELESLANLLGAGADQNVPGAVEALGNLMGLGAIRQALYDVLGAYPSANVVPYASSFQLSSQVPAGPLLANSTGTASIKVTADSAFIARYITGASQGAYLITLRMDASDRQMVNAPIHSSAFVGTAERPMILPKPLLLPANSTISFDLTDLSGANNSIYFSFIGFKIYGYTPAV